MCRRVWQSCLVIGVLLGTLLLAACASPSQPPQFFILQPLAATTDAATSSAVLGVGPIAVADYLDRPQLLHSGGGFELQHSDLERWGEPLERGIIRVTSENLARLTASPQVQRFPFRQDSQPQWVVRAVILALDINAQGQAELRVDWQWVEQATGKRMAGNISRFEQAAGDGPAAQAKAYSELLLQWHTQLAAEIKQLTLPE